MSWFWRGFQSAIFYYVSCAPCTRYAYLRQRSKVRKAEEGTSEIVSADGYAHPKPFSTNIYWREEMVLGPGPPNKKGTREKSRGTDSRGLSTAGPGSSVGASSTDSTLAADSLVGLEVEHESVYGDGWNRKRYQRPDEDLWGLMTNYPDYGSSNASIGINRTDTIGSGTYYTARNPAVNDLHPPIVSSAPTNKNEIKWMLQPPPSAKIMAGKRPATRSRSTSRAGSMGSSQRRAVGIARIEGQVSERAIHEQQYHRRSDASGSKENAVAASIEYQRGPGDLGSPDGSKSPSESPRKKRPPPIVTSNDTSAPFKEQRPPLSTIQSSSNAVPTIDRPRADLPAVGNYSFQAVQERVSTNATKAVLPDLSSDTGIPRTEKENSELQWSGSSVPTSAGDNNNIAAQRWSMDV